MTTKLKRSLSGIKPTGTAHLGNYLGMIRPALELAATHDAFYFIADYHALTTQRDAAGLRAHSRELCAMFLACGLDPAKSTFFRQSDVPEVVELSWILSCVTNLGLLLRAHAYKAALDKGEANLMMAGTFFYPVLMAADILIYDADAVPVGKDQLQHVEMAQDMATHFNEAFGAGTLHRPEPFVRPTVATIVGTDGEKMSKSRANTIELFLPAKPLRKAIMGIKTDSTPVEAPKDPEKDNVFALYRHFATEAERDALAARYRAGGLGYGQAKQELFDLIERELGGARTRYEELLKEGTTIDRVLAEGAARAREVARGVLARVRDKVGLGPLPR